MLAWAGLIRVGLVLVIEAFVDLAVDGLALLGNVAQAANRLFAHHRGFVELQRVFIISLSMELSWPIFA